MVAKRTLLSAFPHPCSASRFLSYIKTLLPLAFFSPEIQIKIENRSSYDTGEKKVETQPH